MKNNSAESAQLLLKLRNCFEKSDTLTDPIQVAVCEKEIKILHAKWHDAMQKDIAKQLMPELLPLFGTHLQQIILFESNSLSHINLAVLLVDYTAKDYRQVSYRIHAIIEQYSEAHATTVSIVTVDHNSLQNHPLCSEIKSGTVIWQKGDLNT